MDDYTGTATLVLAERELPVRVRLRGFFEPTDGRFHWYGRLEASDAVREAAGGRSAGAVLRTPYGEAEGAVGDPDVWGRYRVSGLGRPPFPVAGPEA
jgi:hypothetical protein